MIPLTPGELCPRCRRIVPEAGTSRPFSAPLTEPIELRALDLIQGAGGIEIKGMSAAVRSVLRLEFHASEEVLTRTASRVAHWLAYQEHEAFKRGDNV